MKHIFKNWAFIFLWIIIISGCVWFLKKSDKDNAPLPLEARRPVSLLAKKYEIPLEAVHAIILKRPLKDKEGHVDWQSTIESASKETGVPEKIVASVVIDKLLISDEVASYDEPNSSE